jgi:hypothetical protein
LFRFMHARALECTCAWTQPQCGYILQRQLIVLLSRVRFRMNSATVRRVRQAANRQASPSSSSDPMFSGVRARSSWYVLDLYQARRTKS